MNDHLIACIAILLL